MGSVLNELGGFCLDGLVVAEFAESLVAGFDEFFGGLGGEFVELGFDPGLEEGRGLFRVAVGAA